MDFTNSAGGGGVSGGACIAGGCNFISTSGADNAANNDDFSVFHFGDFDGSLGREAQARSERAFGTRINRRRGCTQRDCTRAPLSDEERIDERNRQLLILGGAVAAVGTGAAAIACTASGVCIVIAGLGISRGLFIADPLDPGAIRGGSRRIIRSSDLRRTDNNRDEITSNVGSSLRVLGRTGTGSETFRAIGSLNGKSITEIRRVLSKFGFRRIGRAGNFQRFVGPGSSNRRLEVQIRPNGEIIRLERLRRRFVRRFDDNGEITQNHNSGEFIRTLGNL